MALNKYDMISDAIADLYRASFYLAKNSKETGLAFFHKAKKQLGSKILLDASKITKNYLYWAEKILDEYKRLKSSLSSS